MLIQPLSLPALQRTQAPARPSAVRFRVSEPSGAGRPMGLASIASLSSLQTLLAVQEVGPSAVERRRRALRRGNDLLEALGRLQLAMLGDGDDAACLDRLQTIVGEDAESIDDSDLAGVLEEIEVRAAVEIAKKTGR